MTRDAVSLESWFAPFHPRYRAVLIALVIFAAALAGLTYAENSVLQTFTASFSGASVHYLFVRTPVALLATFVVLRLLKLASDTAQRTLNIRLQDRVRGDIEREVLARLLRRDDTFFASRPPAEILGRLGSDVARVADQRAQTHMKIKAALQFTANIYFFLLRDWRLGLAAGALTIFGSWVAQRITRPVQELDRALLLADDRVKSTLEDVLRMTAEIQVANLFAKVRRVFERQQIKRSGAALRYGNLTTVYALVGSTSYLLSLVSLFAVALYFLSARQPHLGAALIPVIFKTLPELTSNAMAFADAGLAQELAATSVKRLLEYDAPLPSSNTGDAIAVTTPQALSVEGVTFQYPTHQGQRQGGVLDLTTSFAEGRWTAIVGAAGSGKSTLVQLIVGRLAPQRGTILIGDRAATEIPVHEHARLVTLMPQTVALLDGTLAENLDFGRRSEDAQSSPFDEEDLFVLERLGVAPLCRLKALELQSVAGEITEDIEQRVLTARRAIRAAHAQAGLDARPFHEGGCDPRMWILEGLLAGACDRERATRRILGHRPMASLVESPLGQALVARGRLLVQSTSALLGIATHAAYARLAPQPVSEPLWRLRQRALAASGIDAPPLEDAWRFACVALTSSIGEVGDEWQAPSHPAAARQRLAALVGDALIPFDDQRFHPHLTWRENLSFAAVNVGNRRAEQRLQQSILEGIAAAKLEATLTRAGLRSEVGRGGLRLSGGQRQLVSLGRALLRRTPIVVLDEPTSALDPASRAHVCELLRDWSRGRILITISHDPEVIRRADEVRLLAAGRLIESGTIADLESGSGAVAKLLRSGA